MKTPEAPPTILKWVAPKPSVGHNGAQKTTLVNLDLPGNPPKGATPISRF